MQLCGWASFLNESHHASDHVHVRLFMKLLTSVLQARRSVYRSKDVFGSRGLIRVNWRGTMSSALEDIPGSTGSEGTKVTLETLKFVNRAIKSLPVEENRDNYVRTVPG